MRNYEKDLLALSKNCEQLCDFLDEIGYLNDSPDLIADYDTFTLKTELTNLIDAIYDYFEDKEQEEDD